MMHVMSANFTHPGRFMPLRKLLLVLASVAAFAACSDDDVDSGVGPPGDVGRMRFVNAVTKDTGSVALDVRVAGTPFAVNVAYGAGVPVSPTVYYAVLEGSRDVDVVRTVSPATTVLETTLDVAADASYTLIAVGPFGAVESMLLTDNNTAPAVGQVHIRAANASPSAPSVDVYVTNATADIATLTPSASAIAFKGASAYIPVAAGATRVRFTTAGTKTVIRDVTIGTLAAGAIRTVILLDAQAGGAPRTSTTLVDR